MLPRAKRRTSNKLIALRFEDETAFRKAARIAINHNLPVDASGNYTLIVRKPDKEQFSSFRFKQQTVKPRFGTMK